MSDFRVAYSKLIRAVWADPGLQAQIQSNPALPLPWIEARRALAFPREEKIPGSTSAPCAPNPTLSSFCCNGAASLAIRWRAASEMSSSFIKVLIPHSLDISPRVDSRAKSIS